MAIMAPAHAAALAVLLGLAPAVALARGPASVASAGVSMWGFEPLADGSTRLFVELSKSVTYETKAAQGSVTYVLKGAHVLRRNNTNPLVTVDFNTPVTTARLVPHGRDLWFVLELRASVQPEVSVDPGKDGGAVMKVVLPKGDYLAAGAAHESAQPPPR